MNHEIGVWKNIEQREMKEDFEQIMQLKNPAHHYEYKKRKKCQSENGR